jgi:hypothetical protein
MHQSLAIRTNIFLRCWRCRQRSHKKIMFDVGYVGNAELTYKINISEDP